MEDDITDAKVEFLLIVRLNFETTFLLDLGKTTGNLDRLLLGLFEGLSEGRFLGALLLFLLENQTRKQRRCLCRIQITQHILKDHLCRDQLILGRVQLFFFFHHQSMFFFFFFSSTNLTGNTALELDDLGLVDVVELGEDIKTLLKVRHEVEALVTEGVLEISDEGVKADALVDDRVVLIQLGAVVTLALVHLQPQAFLLPVAINEREVVHLQIPFPPFSFVSECF